MKKALFISAFLLSLLQGFSQHHFTRVGTKIDTVSVQNALFVDSGVRFRHLPAATALDTTNYKLAVLDAAGNVKRMVWQVPGAGITQTALDDTAAAIRSTTASGTYVPSLTGLLNVSSVTSDTAIWTREGNIVTVYGSLTVAVTANSTSTTLDISLPITSSLNGGHACWGAGNTLSFGGADSDAVIHGDATNHKALLGYFSSSTGTSSSIVFNYNFRYQIQ